MVGFVGARARKRRRNRYLFVILILAIFGIFFYLPSIDFTTEEKQPLDEIIPSNVVDESSLRTEIEELKLEVFQKDQRLKFRDDQIKNLRKEINDLNKSFNTVKKSKPSTLPRGSGNYTYGGGAYGASTKFYRNTTNLRVILSNKEPIDGNDGRPLLLQRDSWNE